MKRPFLYIYPGGFVDYINSTMVLFQRFESLARPVHRSLGP